MECVPISLSAIESIRIKIVCDKSVVSLTERGDSVPSSAQVVTNETADLPSGQQLASFGIISRVKGTSRESPTKTSNDCSPDCGLSIPVH